MMFTIYIELQLHHPLWKGSQVSVNIGSGNGVVPSSNKQLPEPVFNQISATPLSHSGLICSATYVNLSFDDDW